MRVYIRIQRRPTRDPIDCFLQEDFYQRARCCS